MTDVELAADLGFLKLRNPLIIASGTFAYGGEYGEVVPLSALGGFVTKGTTLRPRQGNPPPRIWETPSGILNSIGLQNPGVDAFIKYILPKIDARGARLIVNVAGEDSAEYVEVARRLGDADKIDALEINISCPNVAAGGISFGRDPQLAGPLLAAVVQATRKPVIAKLTPNTADFVAVARAAQEAGCAAVSLVNTFQGLAINLASEQPALGNKFGGLSGPAIKPLALYQVYQVAAAVDIPVIGGGGIHGGDDAAEFLLAGARALQIGTALLGDPRAPLRILAGLEDFMAGRGYTRLTDFIGKANPGFTARRR